MQLYIIHECAINFTHIEGKNMFISQDQRDIFSLLWRHNGLDGV